MWIDDLTRFTLPLDVAQPTPVCEVVISHAQNFARPTRGVSVRHVHITALLLLIYDSVQAEMSHVIRDGAIERARAAARALPVELSPRSRRRRRERGGRG